MAAPARHRGFPYRKPPPIRPPRSPMRAMAGGGRGHTRDAARALFAADAVVVPVQMRSVARFATAHGSGTCRTRLGAVAEGPAALSGFARRLLAQRLDRRRLPGRRGGRPTVAVVATIPAVVVAAVGVQASRMGLRHR